MIVLFIAYSNGPTNCCIVPLPTQTAICKVYWVENLQLGISHPLQGEPIVIIGVMGPL